MMEELFCDEEVERHTDEGVDLTFFEGTSAKVYVLVPSEEIRKKRRQDTFRAATAALKEFFGSVQMIICRTFMCGCTTFIFHEVMASFLYSLRGVHTLGGEVFLDVLVFLITFLACSKACRDWEWV